MEEEIWADNLFITHLKRIVVIVFFVVLQIPSMQITAKRTKSEQTDRAWKLNT